MKIKTIFFILSLFISLQTLCFGLENTFYVLRGVASKKSSMKTVSQHANKVHILISQAYHIDKNGVVTGHLDPALVAFAQQHSIKLMAMVTNSSFDKEIAHKFLSNKKAQQKALASLLTLARQYHLYGIQFDFEMMSYKDRSALTQFYQSAAQLFHANGIVLSVVVAPITASGPFQTSYYRRLYENYTGVYDLKALGQLADFVTVMAYDQHIGRIAPGPTASFPWVNAVILHTLKFIPAYKLSLGIPAYSTFWYTGMSGHSRKITLQNDAVSFEGAVAILKKNQAQVRWDNTNKFYYTIFQRNWLNEYLFMEDVSSFQAKYDLAKKYQLRGMSFFRIGLEDPRIWDKL